MPEKQSPNRGYPQAVPDPDRYLSPDDGRPQSGGRCGGTSREVPVPTCHSTAVGCLLRHPSNAANSIDSLARLAPRPSATRPRPLPPGSREYPNRGGKGAQWEQGKVGVRWLCGYMPGRWKSLTYGIQKRSSLHFESPFGD